MKIKVNAQFGEYNREFEVSCGTGETKTFKWLSNVVCQRFALAAPNGALRHRDHFRGITEQAQHPAVEISLANGQIPHPAATLKELNVLEGDSVNVKLIDCLSVDTKSGNPVMSKWATVAFSSSPYAENNEDDEEEEDDVTIDEAERQNQEMIKAKSGFMRIVLGSQMLNLKQIEHHVKVEWEIIGKAMPRLPEAQSIALRSIFQANWAILVEIYQSFAVGGTFTLDIFRDFIDEIGLFPMRSSAALSNRVFQRSCQACGTSQMNFGCFLVSLLLCAQLRHNDTYEFKSNVHTSTEAIQEIFDVNLIPCAKRLSLPAVLKNAFCSDVVLFGLRPHHDDMFGVFEKFASRSHQLPTSLKVANLAECLFYAGLTSDIDVGLSQRLFDEVRAGPIIGRDKERSPLLQEAKYVDDPIPENELSFPEFVEVCSRAGYYRYYQAPRGDQEDEDLLTVGECLVKGVRLAVNTLNKKIQ